MSMNRNRNNNRRKCNVNRQCKLHRYRLKTLNKQQMRNRVGIHRDMNFLCRRNRQQRRWTLRWSSWNNFRILTSCQKKPKSLHRLHQLQQQIKSRVNKGIAFSLRTILEQRCTTQPLTSHGTKLYKHVEHAPQMRKHHLHTWKNR